MKPHTTHTNPYPPTVLLNLVSTYWWNVSVIFFLFSVPVKFRLLPFWRVPFRYPRVHLLLPTPPTPFLPFPCQSTRRSVLCCAPSPVRACRKRSISESSDSSSDGSNSGSRHHHKKSSRSRKLTEVERLAEMERQRRQKEAEQKVSFSLFGFSMTLL